MAILSQSRSELPPSSDSVDTESGRVSQDPERTGENEIKRRVWRKPSSGGSDRVEDPCAFMPARGLLPVIAMAPRWSGRMWEKPSIRKASYSWFIRLRYVVMKD